MWIFRFEAVPLRDVRHRRIRWETRPVFFQQIGRDLESEKTQAFSGEEPLDFDERQLPLLHVKQQVAARAGGREIGRTRDRCKPIPRLDRYQLLAAAADVLA